MSKLYQAISNFDIETYIRSTFSTVKEGHGNEIRINCFSPNGCSGSDYKQHLWVDVEERRWHCFKCGYGSHKEQPGTGSLIQFVMDAEGIAKYKAIQFIKNTTKPTPSDQLMEKLEIAFSKNVKSKENKEIVFPKSFCSYKDFPSYAVKYMKRRGFSKEQIIMYGAQYQAHSDGNNLRQWGRRIIFPIYDLNGRLISATGRLVEPIPSTYYGRTRWTNWTNNNMQSLMWPLGTYEDGIWISLQDLKPDHIVLCEGINDAHAIRELTGITAISMFGKKLSDDQILTLTKIGPKHITIAFDYEGIDKIFKLASSLVGRFERVTVFPFIWEGWEKYDFGNMIEVRNMKIPFLNKINKEFNNLIDVNSSSYLKWITQLKLG